MSIDEAFSPARDERLTAERAYELYWAELLGAAPTFSCVGHGPDGEPCNAPLICACLEKPEQTLRIRPYFRSRRIEDHAATCDVVHGRVDRPTVKLADVFEAERPADHFRSVPPVSQPVPEAAAPVGGAVDRAFADTGAMPTDATPAATPARQRAPAKATGTTPRAGHYYRLSSLVQKFLEHRRDRDLGDAAVEIGGETTTYEALFRNVFRQKVAELTGTRAVWWGKASLRATKEGGYYLRFSRPFRHGDTELRPTITLTARDIDAYPVRKLLRARLDKLIAEAGGSCVVFVWAKPWMPKEAETPFVRFYVNNLDHIDVRGPDILDELRNTSRITGTQP